MLYPLKFKPIIKYKIWGGDKLKHLYHSDDKIGEVWCISDVDGDESIVENGFLQKKTLRTLIEVYKNKLVGSNIYLKYGNKFPLLFKLIDASDNLSIQVHPNDFNAKKIFGDNVVGKNELWYILDSEQSFVYAGFKHFVSKKQYLEYIGNSNIELLLNKYFVNKEELLYIPSGTVHAIGAGNLILEIQQASDITYRIFDYNRLNDIGQLRELHNDLAVDAINYEDVFDCRKKIKFDDNLNLVITTQNFDVYSLSLSFEYSFNFVDTCVIITCVEGNLSYSFEHENSTIVCTESLLVPASCIEHFTVKSNRANILITIPK